MCTYIFSRALKPDQRNLENVGEIVKTALMPGPPLRGGLGAVRFLRGLDFNRLLMVPSGPLTPCGGRHLVFQFLKRTPSWTVQSGQFVFPFGHHATLMRLSIYIHTPLRSQGA